MLLHSYKSRLISVIFSLFCFSVLFAPFAYAALVNINTAGLEELKTLSGIGDVKAQAIINYRTQNGSFVKIEDIKNVSGLGDATYNNIKNIITVGVVAQNNEVTNTNDDEEVVAETKNTTVSSTSSTKSVWLIDNKNTKLEVDIGNNRVSAVGTPIEFKVETNFGTNKASIFEWKFGDGSVEYGPAVHHSYLFPGEYVVILSVNIFGEVIINRINVKVIAPELVISIASNDRVEITNNSKDEVNLFGRALVSGGKIFSFPKDTIILSNQKISFSSAVTGLNPNSKAEVYLMTIGDDPNKSVNGVNKSEEVRLKQISTIQNQLSELNSQMAVAQSYRQIKKDPPVIEVTEDSKKNTEEALEPTSLTASVSTAVQVGWLEKIKRFLLRKQ